MIASFRYAPWGIGHHMQINAPVQTFPQSGGKLPEKGDGFGF
jgi:hypothetical protein